MEHGADWCTPGAVWVCRADVQGVVAHRPSGDVDRRREVVRTCTADAHGGAVALAGVGPFEPLGGGHGCVRVTGRSGRGQVHGGRTDGRVWRCHHIGHHRRSAYRRTGNATGKLVRATVAERRRSGGSRRRCRPSVRSLRPCCRHPGSTAGDALVMW